MLSLLVLLCETRTGVKKLSLQIQPFLSTECPNVEKKEKFYKIYFLGNFTHIHNDRVQRALKTTYHFGWGMGNGMTILPKAWE